jgi:hypothetical protein
MPGMITDESETLRLDNLESEVLEEYVELQTMQHTTAYAFSEESCKIFSGNLSVRSFQRVCSRISIKRDNV